MKTIEYTLACGRDRAVAPSVVEPQPPSRAPRIARLLALAHKLDGLVRAGTIADYAELARLGQISPARLSQILLLLNLSPAIQERILWWSAAEARGLAEKELREIAREVGWVHQNQRFRILCGRRG